MWCNDLESNAAEPREISCHVSPGGGGGEYQFRCANIRTVMIDVVETDRGRLFRGALSLYPACIYSNIKIRVQRPPVRGWYGSMRLSNGRDPPSRLPRKTVFVPRMDRSCSFRSSKYFARPTLCNRPRRRAHATFLRAKTTSGRVGESFYLRPVGDSGKTRK